MVGSSGRVGGDPEERLPVLGARLCMDIIEREHQETFLESLINLCQVTLIKKKRKFSSYIRKFRNGALAKSYMRKDFLIYEEMRKYFPIYEEAVSHVSLPLLHSKIPYTVYKENSIFFFLSVQYTHKTNI